MTQDIMFPGGMARIDPGAVWRALQGWLKADASRSCSLIHTRDGYCCRLLSWSADVGSATAWSELGIADAVGERRLGRR